MKSSGASARHRVCSTATTFAVRGWSVSMANSRNTSRTNLGEHLPHERTFERRLNDTHQPGQHDEHIIGRLSLPNHALPAVKTCSDARDTRRSNRSRSSDRNSGIIANVSA